MKYKFLYVVLALFFAHLNSMEEGDSETILNHENLEIVSQQGFGNQPNSLKEIVTKFLARKLMHDIKAEVKGEKEESYKDYLASYPLNGEVSSCVVSALLKNESMLLWQCLPIDVIHQNIGMCCTDIIPLANNRLLVIYNESSASESNNYSKIKIWDMRSEDWVDVDIQLPKITVYNAILSKDLKTLFLWCYGYFVLVYDLEKNTKISRIISNPNVIKSVCLLNDDNVCCGLVDGTVKIFDKDTAKELFSFKAANTIINSIDFTGDVLATVNLFHVKSWKLSKDKKGMYQCAAIAKWRMDYASKVKLGLKGKAIIINSSFLQRGIFPQRETVLFLSIPESILLKDYDFCSSFAGFKRSQDGTMLFAAQGEYTLMRTPSCDKFSSLAILDAETGVVVKEFVFTKDKESFSDNRSPIQWRGFAISSDNSFIVLYDKQGRIAKVSLNLDQSLDAILQKIRSHLTKKNASSCLIS